MGAFIARAMPKSATFTWPFEPIRMLAGLMSRCTTPAAWAKPSAAATSLAISAACFGGELPVGAQDLGERAALHVLHGDEVGAVVLAPVVDADDVGVGEVGRRLGLAAEALDEVGVDGELGEQHLDRDLAIEQAGRGRGTRRPCRRARCACGSRSGR